MSVRVQLKTLTAENAEMTARHLAMVGYLHDQDPELALRHAKAAAKRAGRIAVVRETLGIAAYIAGDYALALRELTTYRRLSGSIEQVPLMVDAERGLGRPERGLQLGRSIDRKKLSPESRVNLAIALSGARLDLGEDELALAELEIPELDPKRVFEYSIPLFRAYAETLKGLKRAAESKQWLDLAERAEQHFSAKTTGESEVFEVLEEIEIPKPHPRGKSENPRSGKMRENRDMEEKSDKPEKPKRPPFEKKQGNFGPPPKGGKGNNRGFGGPPKGRSRGPGRGR